ncbi:MAG: histidine phosphatase family protein [archaeon]|nr:histidine phosphatase family protein [archaeon]
MKAPTVLLPDEWPAKVGPHTVTFVRHAEKNGGGFMADLTPAGVRDSIEAGRHIGCRVDLFLASPSPRTMSTARGIREGNGSNATLVAEEQLAEPGNGFTTDFRQALKSFFTRILELVEENRPDIVLATTHNYVVEYVAAVFGTRAGSPDYLSGITVNLELLSQMCESL